ncbi:MAG: (d)CMP kinase, partial [Atopobium sp.]|nr:(d)CMP kinase [Atopobium sp.]
MSSHGSVICIVGPTASGKSSLSELVAKKLETSVISVDAMQVYRGMDIGTAKTPVEEREVPLLMVDCANISEEYSVQMFQTAAREEAHKLINAGKTPVFCGGTGLYLDSIIDQMEFPSGSVESPVRTRYEKLAEELGPEGLHEVLATKDAASAELIHPNNVRRVVRALELLEEGKSYATHHEGLKAHTPYFDAQIWGLT